MSKKNQKAVNTKVLEEDATQNSEVELSETVSEPKMKEKKEKKQKDAKKVSKKASNGEVKRSRIKETFAELKKVTWPTFGKTMKQAGMVLSVVLIFGVVVFGFDLLISYIIKLLSSI